MLETEETTQQNVIEYALGVELTAKEVSKEKLRIDIIRDSVNSL